MKSIILIIAAVAFTACSSTKKTETATTSTEAPTTVEKTETTSTDTAPEKTSKKSKKQKTASTEETTTTPSTDGSGLPSITGTEKSAVTCTNKSDTRKITTLNVTDGGCGVVYNKAGEDKTVALAKVDMNYCDTVTNKIKTNLEGAGFNCGGGASSSSDTPAAQ